MSSTSHLQPVLRGEERQHFVRNAPLAFIAILWLGVLLGVSFLATPVKFQAPSLDLPTALEVGRVTFTLFAKVEWILCALLIVAGLAAHHSGVWRWLAVVMLTLIVVLQAAWLLPALDARLGQIVAGASVPASNHHVLYIVAESLKALLLIALSVEALWRLATPGSGARDS